MENMNISEQVSTYAYNMSIMCNDMKMSRAWEDVESIANTCQQMSNEETINYLFNTGIELEWPDKIMDYLNNL